jgi:transcriptional regulator with PAS, ATPase and Fis domain
MASNESEFLPPGRVPARAFQNIVGASEKLRATVAEACRVAAHSNVTVLIYGETGTGKELFARGIHYSGPSAAEPFVAINCAAIPEALLESELFGHERGAFSGATNTKKGLFEFAGTGTVFLDEIGELPMNLQSKLLRVLEDRRLRRVGGLTERPVECRVIAATNRHLSERVSQNQFREDLYYRLNVVSLELPALRDREEDILALARYFVDVLCRERGVAAKRLSAASLDILAGYRWPGNVRELRNTIERAVIMAEGEMIQPEHIIIRRRATDYAATQPANDELMVKLPSRGVSLEEAEKKVILATLELTSGNQSRAARILGISRPRLSRKLQKYGVPESS